MRSKEDDRKLTLVVLWVSSSLASITGALWTKQGERGISREARNEWEAQNAAFASLGS